MTAQRDAVDQERNELLARISAYEQALEDLRLTEALHSLLTVPLTIRQLKVLAIVVAGNGSSTAQRLANTLDVSLATISGIIDRLVEQGTVTREESQTDHRVNNIVATDEGARIVKNLTASSNQIRTDVMRRLDIADLRALAQGIEALIAVFADVSGDDTSGEN